MREYKVCIYDNEVKPVELNEKPQRIEHKMVTVYFPYYRKEIKQFMDKLYELHNDFVIKYGEFPTALYLGYDDYKKLMFAINQCDLSNYGSPMTVSTFNGIPINILPNYFSHVSFGYKDPVKQFQFEARMREVLL